MNDMMQGTGRNQTEDSYSKQSRVPGKQRRGKRTMQKVFYFLQVSWNLPWRRPGILFQKRGFVIPS
jgi:hypothetical protein